MASSSIYIRLEICVSSDSKDIHVSFNLGAKMIIVNYKKVRPLLVHHLLHNRLCGENKNLSCHNVLLKAFFVLMPDQEQLEVWRNDNTLK